MLNISLDLTDKFKRKKLMENNCWGRYKPTLNDLKPSILGGGLSFADFHTLKQLIWQIQM
jgi:hypothetical protein